MQCKSSESYNVANNKAFSLTLPADFEKLKMDAKNKPVVEEKVEEAKAEEAVLVEKVEEIKDIKSFVKDNDKKAVHDAIIGNDDSEKIYLPEVTVTVNNSAFNNKNVQLSVSYLSQMPELPTGCEITALTTVLNYFGYNVNKCTMADNFLPKCGVGDGSFWNYFLGNPRDEYSFGCYASPIVTAANGYLATQGSGHTAYNYSNSSFTTLLQQIEAGYPVVLWSTMNLKEAFMTRKWVVNGETIQWTAPEHCVAMIGYDLNAGTVTISDPMCGMVTRDLNTMASRYEQMHSQAVVIKPNKKVIEPATEPATQPTTEPATEPATQPATQPVTEPVTQPVTEKGTNPTTEKSTEKVI